MIRKCNEQDRTQLMEFITKRPAENLFMIGDIEAYGFENDIQTVWAQFEREQIIAVMLLFNSNHILYSEGEYDAKGFANIISTYKGRFEVSGLQEVVKQIRPYIHFNTYRDVETYYAKCEELAYSIEVTDYSDVVKLLPEEYEENIKLLRSIPEFENGNFSVENRIRAEKDKTGRTYILRNKQGVMTSSATATAENSQSAMIVGVGTRPGYEKQGYATKVVEKLTADLLSEQKIVCLFYHNPKAGAIYKRIGYEDIGMWSLIGYKGE